MFSFRQIQKSMEMINTVYAFLGLLALSIVFIIKNSAFFGKLSLPLLFFVLGLFIGVSMMSLRKRHDVKILSEAMTYKIAEDGSYKLYYSLRIRVLKDYLRVYPISYHWTGNGTEHLPLITVTGSGQTLLAPVELNKSSRQLVPRPLRSEAGWRSWFIAFDRPLRRGDSIDIEYAQEFNDHKGRAEPYLMYYVRSVGVLDLSVIFPPNKKPSSVIGKNSKYYDLAMASTVRGVKYDSDKNIANWTISRPKRGCYWITWKI